MDSNLEVQFNPAPEYIFGYLIADVQTAECIFDLIDNSIDAARASIWQIDGNSDSLPSDYSGFKIDITLKPEKVVIHDNCSGMSEDIFTSLAFRAGEKSNHPYGIGHFGVGLKRAILKIGDRCTVETDNLQAKLKLTFTRTELNQAAELKLPASKSASTGDRYTTISVEEIKADTKRDLSSLTWRNTTVKNISRRYGLFIRKGLQITVDGLTIESFAPQPTDNDYIKIQTFHSKIHGVDVEIVAGVHEQYRFGENSKGGIGASPDNLAVHKKIANEYGWYVVCNDRVILLHDTSYKTGWTTNWHPEYSGFVGWVFFQSKDPSLLPWNTKKSDIVENSEVYEEIIPTLQKMASQYRQSTPLARRSTRTLSKTNSKPSKRQRKGPTAQAILEGTATKSELKSIATVLPRDIAFASKLPKLAGLVDDCQRLEIEAFPYTSAIMLRTIFDTALRDYLKRYKYFAEMRDTVLDGKMKTGQKATQAERLNFAPALSEMVTWCSQNITAFPDPHGRVCRQACQRFAHHLPILNGVVHEEGGISNHGQVRIMRDEVLQGLLHILES